MILFHPPGHMRLLPWIGFVLLGPLFGQDTPPSDWREKVEEALREGRERVALGLLAEEIEKPSAPARALEIFADVAENVGDYDRADAIARRWIEEQPADPRARMHRARQLLRRREHDAALAVLKPLLEPGPERDDAPKWNFPAVALAGTIEKDRRGKEAAEKYFDRLVAESQRVIVRDPGDLAALAAAVLFFGGAQGVNEAEKDLIAAQKAGGGPEVDVQLGRLYLERKYLWADAAEEFKAARKKRPKYFPAVFNLALAYAAGREEPRAREAIAEAAAVNPTDADLLVHQAREDLTGFQVGRAAEKISRGLRAHPTHVGLQTLSTAQALLSGRLEDYDRGLRELLAANPGSGEPLMTIAGILNERRRWPEALDLMTRAVEIEKDNPALFDDHARYALYLGRNAAAEASLKAADECDAFSHPWRTNIGKLLRRLARKYQSVETPTFTVRFETERLPALSRQLLPFFESSYRMLTEKYRFNPGGVVDEGNRMVVEVYGDHQDFSVRTFGFDGLGALGVCFGPFIAMVAPNALPAGAFSWARTFHHELAHTMTLGISKGRVPRWLTEGLSTWEEEEFDPAWTRGMDRELFDAFHTGDLLKLAEFDPAFGTPRIIYAYYQGGLVSGWLVRTYGLDKVLEALRLFGEDRSQEDVFQRAFGVPTAVIDEGFAKAVAERIAPMKMQPRYRAEVRERMEAEWKARPTDDLLVRLAWARLQNKQVADAEALVAEARKRGMRDPRLELLEARLAEAAGRADRAKALFARLEEQGFEDYDLTLALARAAEKKGASDDATGLYRRAIACFPSNADKDGPRVALARLLRGEGRTEEAIAMLEEHLRHSPEDLVSLRAVIDHRRAQGDAKAALALLEKFVLIHPLDAGIHLMRSDLMLGAGDGAPALLAADCALECSTTAAAKGTAEVSAAKALLALGRKDEARSRLDEALRLVPRNPEALRMVGELESRPHGESR